MSWAEVKKINSNLSKSLDALINEKISNVISKIGFQFVNIYTGDGNPITISGINGFVWIGVAVDTGAYKVNGNTRVIAVNNKIPTLIPLASNETCKFTIYPNSYAYVYRFGGGS